MFNPRCRGGLRKFIQNVLIQCRTFFHLELPFLIQLRSNVFQCLRGCKELGCLFILSHAFSDLFRVDDNCAQESYAWINHSRLVPRTKINFNSGTYTELYLGMLWKFTLLTWLRSETSSWYSPTTSLISSLRRISSFLISSSRPSLTFKFSSLCLSIILSSSTVACSGSNRLLVSETPWRLIVLLNLSSSASIFFWSTFQPSILS